VAVGSWTLSLLMGEFSRRGAEAQRTEVWWRWSGGNGLVTRAKRSGADLRPLTSDLRTRAEGPVPRHATSCRVKQRSAVGGAVAVGSWTLSLLMGGGLAQRRRQRTEVWWRWSGDDGLVTRAKRSGADLRPQTSDLRTRAEGPVPRHATSCRVKQRSAVGEAVAVGSWTLSLLMGGGLAQRRRQRTEVWWRWSGDDGPVTRAKRSGADLRPLTSDLRTRAAGPVPRHATSCRA
jgi:hypothetical protein